jgi:hypothetical protein
MLLRYDAAGLAILFIGFFNLLQTRLCIAVGVVHLSLNPINILLLRADNMSQIFVDFIDLMHAPINVANFLFSLAHNLFL